MYVYKCIFLWFVNDFLIARPANIRILYMDIIVSINPKIPWSTA